MAECGGGDGKPLCPICYEDLKPLSEELQSISACGHVFHELCIQQWVEYCQAGKRPTCPVCKQSFLTGKDLVRLFFQSDGNGCDATQRPSSQTTQRPSVEAEEARNQCRRLEGRLDSLTTLLETQTKRVEELNAEVSRLKDRASKEEGLKATYRQEKEGISRLLQAKEKELSTTSVECARHKERALALAKELASLKLVSDANLEEEEIERLVSIGNESRQADKIDILKRSLVIRNKKYKELMSQCNRLGRAESRALQKLEKAEEKILKLKERLLELEKNNEEKENGFLRNIKASKRIVDHTTTVDIMQRLRTVSNAGICSPEVHDESPPRIVQKVNGVFSSNSLFLSKKSGQLSTVEVGLSSKGIAINPVPDPLYPGEGDKDLCNRMDDHSTISNRHPGQSSNNGSRDVHNCDMYGLSGKGNASLNQVTAGNLSTEAHIKVVNTNNDINVVNITARKNTSASPADILLIQDDDFEDEPLPIINKLAQESAPLTEIPCFSRGLLHGEGGNGHKAKWIPRGKPLTFPTQTSNDGCLIGVGSDGKGGRVKMLRTLERPDKVQTLPKRHKAEAKTVGVAKKNLQIEHFFGKQIQR